MESVGIGGESRTVISSVADQLAGIADSVRRGGEGGGRGGAGGKCGNRLREQDRRGRGLRGGGWGRDGTRGSIFVGLLLPLLFLQESFQSHLGLLRSFFTTGKECTTKVSSCGHTHYSDAHARNGSHYAPYNRVRDWSRARTATRTPSKREV